MDIQKKLIIVTGAGGYIGTSLVPFLLSKGYRVRAIDRFFFGENLLVPNINFQTLKIKMHEEMKKLYLERYHRKQK